MLSNKVTGDVGHDTTFVDLMKTILHFSIAFEKVYNDMLFATRIVDVVKDMMSSDFLAGMSA